MNTNIKNIENIKNIQKMYFSNLQSNFDKLLNKMDKSNIIQNRNLLIKLIKLKELFNNLDVFIDEINNDINHTKKNNLDKELEVELYNYNHNEEIIQTFIPYMIAYSFYLDSKNI